MSKDGEVWCGPTREFESSQLVKLLHKTRRSEELEAIKPEKPEVFADATPAKPVVTSKPAPVSATPPPPPKQVAKPSPTPILVPMSPSIDPLPSTRVFGRRTGRNVAVYPVYKDSYGPLRIVIGVGLLLAVIAIALFVLSSL